MGLWTKFLGYIKNYKYSFLTFIPLLVLSYLLNGKMFFAVINIASLFFLFNILAKTKYTFLVSSILVIFITSDIVYYLLYSSSMYVGILSSIMETTPKESKEMFGELYIWIVPVLLIVIFLVVKMLGELKRNNLKRIYAIGAFIGITFVLIPVYLFVNLSRDKDVQIQALYANNPLLWSQTVISSKFPVVYNDIAIYVAYFTERIKINNLLSSHKEIPEGLSPDSTAQVVERIYLVIGESSFRGHYSLYGYDVETTPFLDSLKNNTDQLHYYNAISPAPLTRDAIRFSLSFGTPLDQDAFFTKKNIIELAKDQGYETVWISNQERVGSFDNYTGMLASSADKTFFQTKHELYRNDLDLIKELDSYSKPSTKQFIILHLAGSHMPYEYRSDSIAEKAIPLHNTVNVTKYDRTIHYTDRVLKEIYDYSIKNDKQSIIYYFSDHGESIGKGHGLINEGIEQFEIPLVVINNNTEIAIDSIVNQYMQPQLNVINNVNSVYILAEILGYKVSRNLIDAGLKEGRYIYHVDGRAYLFNKLK
ncbi:glucan phosphoethanolaminetransferase (alkaline phosphatase superfamily) [Dysgonomonas alginatilytica]|uniref:Glucan phosphoethanolaminetransferase (Alkaline phosphatase superfamily) n=2 Tax=Dysgonomonas alginatilytica TaxID=1605892 RepID=A0A2V3PV10_9BACT|nr:glucan phosphoethanolaminetransferase (alkaline phosphatase superfamily) [Dysgonomonas alginatilytica]